MEYQPNVWYVLGILATGILAIAGQIVSHIFTKQRQDPALQRIEILANGNLARAKEEVSLLEAQVRSLGAEPVTAARPAAAPPAPSA